MMHRNCGNENCAEVVEIFTVDQLYKTIISKSETDNVLWVRNNEDCDDMFVYNASIENDELTLFVTCENCQPMTLRQMKNILKYAIRNNLANAYVVCKVADDETEYGIVNVYRNSDRLELVCNPIIDQFEESEDCNDDECCDECDQYKDDSIVVEVNGMPIAITNADRKYLLTKYHQSTKLEDTRYSDELNEVFDEFFERLDDVVNKYTKLYPHEADNILEQVQQKFEELE